MCGNKTEYTPLLVKKFKNLGMWSLIIFSGHVQTAVLSIFLQRNVLFSFIILVVKMFVCCTFFCQAVVHAKRKK